MRERVQGLVGRAGRGVFMGTFHALGLHLLKEQQGQAALHDLRRRRPTRRRAGVLAPAEVGGSPLRPKAILFRISRAKNDFLRRKKWPRARTSCATSMTRRRRSCTPSTRTGLRGFAAFDFDDLIVEPVRLALPEWRTRYPLPARRRVPGHQPRAARCSCATRRRAREPVRRGRRRPVDLRLARRGRGQHPRVRAPLPGREGGQARGELPLDAGDPRRGERRHRAQRSASRQDALDNAARGEPRPRRGRADDPRRRRVRCATEIERLRERRRSRLRGALPIEHPGAAARGGAARSGMPYEVFGGQEFYERKEVKDVFAYLLGALSARRDLAAPGGQLSGARDRGGQVGEGRRCRPRARGAPGDRAGVHGGHRAPSTADRQR